MAIDPATRASLEIEKRQSGGREGSLLAAIDRTVTAPAARACWPRGWPGRCSIPAAIDARLDAVAWLLRAPRRCAQTPARGAEGRRATWPARSSRLALGRGGPRDLGCPARWPGGRRRDLPACSPPTRDPLVAPPAEIADGAGRP